MKNWTGNQVWYPKDFFQPSSSEEIISIVKSAIKDKKVIRVIGSKYSFNALNNTDSITLNLDKYQGLINVDKDNLKVTVKSGTKLYNLNKLLSEQGLALENMLDIDKQSIAGAISTGTNGTGIYYGNLSTQVTGIKFINGLGEEVFCSEKEKPILFKCMQLSLGCLGIITEITLGCVKNYKLKLDKKILKLSKVLNKITDYNLNNRHFEFYWFPYTNKTLSKFSNVTNFEEDKETFFNFFNDSIIENYGLITLGTIAKLFPFFNVAASKISSSFISDSVKVKECKDIFVSARKVKFSEMGYNVPIEAYKDAFKDVVKLVNSKKYKIHYPVECRFLKKDDIFLSPSYNRDSAFISCHIFGGKNFNPYFKALEEIFTAYDGRPHWGKIHYKTSDYFALKYPMFDEFNKQRIEQDPHQIFLNDYLKSILL